MTTGAEDPLVSVVIPTYQRAAEVDRALSSIDEPGIDPARIQVIVVDNASQDATASVVARHRDRLPCVEFESWPENVGPIENWRRGIAMARAPWLKILWSDDTLMPRAIEGMLFAAERYSASVVTCRVAVDYPTGASVERYLDRPTTLTPDIVASELLHFPAGLPSSPGAALVRTSDAAIALRHPLPDPCLRRAIGPDLLMTYWGVFSGGVGIHLPDVLARFAAGDDSITMRTPRAVLSSCYGAATSELIQLATVDGHHDPVSTTTMRRLRSRAALDAMLGGERDALLPERNLSLRATAYDSYQISKHWVGTHVFRKRTI